MLSLQLSVTYTSFQQKSKPTRAWVCVLTLLCVEQPSVPRRDRLALLAGRKGDSPVQGAPACSRLWGHTREGARPHCSGVACTVMSLQAVGLLDPQQLRRGLRPARSSCSFHGASRAPSGQEPIRALSSPAAARSEGTPDGPGNPAEATRERPPADISGKLRTSHVRTTARPPSLPHGTSSPDVPPPGTRSLAPADPRL